MAEGNDRGVIPGAVYDLQVRSRGSWHTVLVAAMVIVPVSLIIGAVIQGGFASLLSWRILLIAVIDLLIWLAARYMKDTGVVESEDVMKLYDGMVPVEPDGNGGGFRAAKRITVPADGGVVGFRFQTGEEWDGRMTGPMHVHDAILAVHDGMAAVMIAEPDGGGSAAQAGDGRMPDDGQAGGQ